jgi:hypothetical protein
MKVMKTTKLLSTALISIIALTVLSAAGVAATTKTAALQPNGLADYGTALDSGTLLWRR